jgi:hypothetical protein
MTLAKRPFGVWLILTFYVFATCFLYIELLSLVSYFPNLGILVLGAITGGAVNIIAAVLLFRLRRSAVVLFGISFMFSTVMTIRSLIGSNWKAMNAANSGGIAIGWLIALAIFLYTLKLRQRGILQ